VFSSSGTFHNPNVNSVKKVNLRFCQKTYDGDEMFWFNTTMLMVEATLADYELKMGERTRKVFILLDVISFCCA
jgi:hypothetical protein